MACERIMLGGNKQAAGALLKFRAANLQARQRAFAPGLAGATLAIREKMC